MSRVSSVKRLAVAAALVGGIVVACRTVRPGEAPPLAPRPEPIEPSPTPVPGAPDPLEPPAPAPGPRRAIDAGPTGVPPTTRSGAVSELEPAIYLAQVSSARPAQGAADAAPPDDALADAAVDAPEITDPDVDAGAPADATAANDAAGEDAFGLPAPPDAAEDDGGLLPPVPPVDDAMPLDGGIFEPGARSGVGARAP